MLTCRSYHPGLMKQCLKNVQCKTMVWLDWSNKQWMFSQRSIFHLLCETEIWFWLKLIVVHNLIYDLFFYNTWYCKLCDLINIKTHFKVICISEVNQTLTIDLLTSSTRGLFVCLLSEMTYQRWIEYNFTTTRAGTDF